jgi:hypothetical protein
MVNGRVNWTPLLSPTALRNCDAAVSHSWPKAIVAKMLLKILQHFITSFE